LAEQVGVHELYYSQTPEQKVQLVHEVTKVAPTLFVGDGINDAPALKAATVGIALGANVDITSDAADAVVLDRSLSKVDELLHIGKLLRKIALQSAVGGMVLSFGGMLLASVGLLPPVAGALLQEVIDLIAVSNSLRTAISPKQLTDFDQTSN
jgi:P-type E1-E2 ATPase